jgi:hypothetical protein
MTELTQKLKCPNCKKELVYAFFDNTMGVR